MGLSVTALRKTIRAGILSLTVPNLAREVRRRDRAGLPEFDLGPERAIAEGLSWLCYAQDRSASQDGGVARHFSLIDGWGHSYPETTGYIADTFIAIGEERGDLHLLARARRMLDWLVSIEFSNGAYQGGMVHELPRVPATFDTGQILMGLAAGTRLDAQYREPMVKAADWLLASQDADGCWRKHETPYALAGDKAYETHAAIGLFRASAVEKDRGYLKGAMAQVDWALGQQQPNGWFAKCCLSDLEKPLTHTLGYAFRGVIEAYMATGQKRYLEAACRTADGVLGALGPDGRLSGRLDNRWQGAVDWVCLTGTAQFAECLLLLWGYTAREHYKRAGLIANAFVRRTIATSGPREIRGGVKGSFPVDGWYGKWQYLNWACKFMIDANRAELRAITNDPPTMRR